MKKNINTEKFLQYLTSGSQFFDEETLENVENALKTTEEQIVNEEHDYNGYKTTNDFLTLMQVPSINKFRDNLKSEGISTSTIENIINNFDIWISTSMI